MDWVKVVDVSDFGQNSRLGTMCFRLPDESATGGPRIGIGSAVTSAAVLNIIFAQDRITVIEKSDKYSAESDSYSFRRFERP
jgi:hypothetical protein